MKPIYLIQPNFQSKFNGRSNYWLPYSVGTLWSYANQFSEITQNYKLAKFIIKRDNIASLVDTFEGSSVFAFSCYVWNWEYNKALAKAIKKKYPSSYIIFGGPQVSKRPLETNFFKNHPYVNSIVIGEGEIGFVKCLTDHALGKNQKIFHSERLADLEIPSPYLTGLFDQLISENPDVIWSATIETNRGCPYACTFCDWGSLTYNKIKKFNEQKVYQELDWMGKHNIDYLVIADANFGVFKERDYNIVKHLCKIKTQYGYPTNLNLNYNKNSNEHVAKIIELLSKSSLSRGVTLSFQSMDETVLTHIKRANMSINQAEQIFQLLEKRQLNYYSELILGLPMETLESWKEGHWKLLNAGQHKCIDVFFTMMLENSELNHPDYKNNYQIETFEVSDFFYTNFEVDTGIDEKISYVKSTSTMTTNDLSDAFMFSWLITNLHSYGWAQIYSRFLNNFKNIGYKEFYTDLHDAIVNNRLVNISTFYNLYKEKLKLYLTDNSAYRKQNFSANILGNVQKKFHTMNDEIHREIFKHVKSTYAHLLDDQLFNRLYQYQTHYVSSYQNSYPYQTVLDIGIQHTILNNLPYKTKLTNTLVEISGEFFNKDDFLLKLQAHRRNNWGKTVITEINQQTVDNNLNTLYN